MRKSVLLSFTTVALALMFAPPVSVAQPPVSVAQPYDAPASFTGWLQSLPNDGEEACGGRLERSEPVEQVRDFRCEGWMGTTDPRFTGRFVMESNNDTYSELLGVLGDGSLTVSTVAHRVENDDGAWMAPPTVTAWWVAEADDEGTVSQSERTIPTEPITFFGEGDYESLTAIVWFNPFIVNSQLWGVILEGEPPPAPTESG